MIGIYGMSTALWMLREGGYEVTILDRCEELPALDAASTGVFTSSLSLKKKED
jgi:sarcosine oxidase/L-pipecolate oxidase